MFRAYGDDSADEKRGRVFAAATVTGSEDQWDSFESKWRAINEDRPFHATDCESDKGLFGPPEGASQHEEDATHKTNKELYRNNIHALIESRLIGTGVAISIADYKLVFPFAPPDDAWPYYMCFSGAIICAANTAKWSIPQDHLKVTFDRNREREINSIDIYEFMLKEADDLGPILEDEIAFADHRKHIGIQAADLVAFETMKALHNQLREPPRWPRQSLIELKRSNRFSFILYDRSRLENHRREADEIHLHSNKSAEYKKWMESKGLPDNTRTRLRFFASERNGILKA